MAQKRHFGSVEDFPVGTIFRSRAQLSAATVHRPTQAGISGSKIDGADSIVLNGGYVDDEDDHHSTAMDLQPLWTGSERRMELGRERRVMALTAVYSASHSHPLEPIMRTDISFDIGRENDFATAKGRRAYPLCADALPPRYDPRSTSLPHTVMTTLPLAWCPNMWETAFAASLSG
jgi:hypothetical protein